MTEGGEGTEGAPQRSRMVTIVGLFLLIEAAGLAVGGLFQWMPGKPASLPSVLVRLLDDPSMAWIADLPFGVLFLPLATLAFSGAVAFLRLKPAGWMLAMIVQAMSLFIALISYFSSQSEGYIYPVMIYCIMMVAYLNHPEVKRTFYPRES